MKPYLANFIKKMHPRKEKKKKHGAMTKVKASKQPKEDGQQEGNGTTKYRNLHQSLETYQLKKKGSILDETPHLEEPSPIVTIHLEMEVACIFFKVTNILYL